MQEHTGMLPQNTSRLASVIPDFRRDVISHGKPHPSKYSYSETLVKKKQKKKKKNWHILNFLYDLPDDVESKSKYIPMYSPI